MSRYRLRLYVTGQTAKSQKAIANIQNILDSQLQGEYELEVVDVLERPGLAEDEKIIATPALLRELPPPLRRVIGDLSDRDQVLLGLDLKPTEEGQADSGPGSD